MVMKKVASAILAIMLAAAAGVAPAAAQDYLPAGPAGDPLKFWEGYSVGTYVIVGGFVFVVTLGGLQLIGGDDNSKPKPGDIVPPPSTSTTSTGS